MACFSCEHSTLQDLGTTDEGRLWRCGHCGSLRLEGSVRLAAAEHGEYSAAYRLGMDQAKSLRLFELFCRLLPDCSSNGLSLLDVGCGNGAFLELALGCGWQVCGVDADHGAVATLQARGIHAITGTVGECFVPLEQAFDVVTLWDLIEHVPNLDQALSWLSTAVRLGGRVMVLTPNAASVLDVLAHWERRLSAGKSNRLMNLCLNRYHLHRFTPQGLATLFRRYGFVAESVSTIQLMSLRPGQYLSGFAPGMLGWTASAWINRLASQVAYHLLRLSAIKNKILYVGRRLDAKAANISRSPLMPPQAVDIHEGSSAKASIWDHTCKIKDTA